MEVSALSVFQVIKGQDYRIRIIIDEGHPFTFCSATSPPSQLIRAATTSRRASFTPRVSLTRCLPSQLRYTRQERDIKMPYNTNPIMPTAEVTGTVSLPCTASCSLCKSHVLSLVDSGQSKEDYQCR